MVKQQIANAIIEVKNISLLENRKNLRFKLAVYYSCENKVNNSE